MTLEEREFELDVVRRYPQVPLWATRALFGMRKTFQETKDSAKRFADAAEGER